VSGGANGIGASSCIELAREGAHVIVADLANQEKHAEQIIEEIRKFGGKAKFVPLDVTDEKQWQQAITETEKAFGPLDVVFNNAGIGSLEPPLEDMPLDAWRKVQKVNYDGVFLGTKYAIQSMKRNTDIQGSGKFEFGKTTGSIINCSSILGLVGMGSASAYSASKGGIRLLTKSTALYCADNKLNIRANSVHPAFIQTPMTDQLQGDVRIAITGMHPLGRFGMAKEIAMGVVFLASDESSFVTGTELVIDGGYTCK
jgi:NAD(P)-dependent dehydrogenase (short-subunit alcohol dehydrogenase family)